MRILSANRIRQGNASSFPPVDNQMVTDAVTVPPAAARPRHNRWS
jgi:hypothetical protein